MKKHIWADPTKEWEGFRFTAYSLDFGKVWELPLTQVRVTDGNEKQVPTTLGKIYAALADQHFEIEINALSVQLSAITVATDKLAFRGDSFSRQLLSTLLQLKKEDLDPFSTLWFWFDSDSCSDDPHESYSFFVVLGNKIVRESVSFSDYHNSGFDPTIFKSHDDSDSIWFNDSDWREANTRFWYRKFYTETRTGQLMVLRPDEPILYHHERPQTRNIERELQFVTLLKDVQTLLGCPAPLSRACLPVVERLHGNRSRCVGGQLPVALLGNAQSWQATKKPIKAALILGRTGTDAIQDYVR